MGVEQIQVKLDRFKKRAKIGGIVALATLIGLITSFKLILFVAVVLAVGLGIAYIFAELMDAWHAMDRYQTAVRELDDVFPRAKQHYKDGYSKTSYAIQDVNDRLVKLDKMRTSYCRTPLLNKVLFAWLDKTSNFNKDNYDYTK